MIISIIDIIPEYKGSKSFKLIQWSLNANEIQAILQMTEGWMKKGGDWEETQMIIVNALDLLRTTLRQTPMILKLFYS